MNDIRILNLIETLIKNEIKRLDLVKSGKMLNSIKVSYINNNIIVNSVDYFKKHNDEFHIVANVLKSNKLKNLIKKVISEDLKKQIIKELK